jgi:uncharacterized protein (DUF924 family)
MSVHPRDVLDFWFAAGPAKWFAKDAKFDAEIAKRFGAAHGQAAAGALDEWATDGQGALALLILLDQFSRNLYRESHQAFLQDAQALSIADQSIARRFDVETPITARKWFYMPYMHAEDLKMQMKCLEFCQQRLNDPETLRYAELHMDIIRRFGRFPHRNAVLGRVTTPQEQSYLDMGGFAG